MLTNNSKKIIIIVAAIVLLGYVGVSMPYPIFAPLFLHPTSGSIISPDWPQGLRRLLLGITLSVYPLGQFVGSPILGSLSDHYGRKRILIISLVMTSIFYLMAGFSIKYRILWLLVISDFFAGCFEGNISIARAIATDLKDYNKHRSFGLVNAMASIGFVIGPLFGGLFSDNTIVRWFNFSLPFYVAAILTILTAIIATKLLKSIPQTFTKSRLSLLREFNIVSRIKRLSVNRMLGQILFASTIFTLSVDTFYEFGAVYLAGVWKFNPSQIALFNTVLCVALAIGNGWVVYKISRHLSESLIIKFNIILFVFLLLSLIFASNEWIVGVIFLLNGFVISSAVTSFSISISNVSLPTIQGEVLGTMTGLRMLGDGSICLLGGMISVVSIKLVLFLAAIASVIAFIYYARITHSGGSQELK